MLKYIIWRINRNICYTYVPIERTDIVKVTWASDWRIRIKAHNRDIADMSYKKSRNVKIPKVTVRKTFNIEKNKDFFIKI